MTKSRMLLAAMILLGVSAVASTWLWWVPKPSHAFTIEPASTASAKR